MALSRMHLREPSQKLIVPTVRQRPAARAWLGLGFGLGLGRAEARVGRAEARAREG